MSSQPSSGVVELAYRPRKQFLAFHLRRQRFACMVAHRRAGKTVTCVNELINRGIHFRKRGPDGQIFKRPRYAYIGPLLKQAKKIAWEYLKEYSQGLTSKKPSESELYVRLAHNDAEIGIYGADNPDSFRGQYFDGVVLDEYGDMSPSVWSAVLLPTLADRDGWAAFIGTFKGKNHFYRVYRNSQGLDLPEGEDSAFWIDHWFNYLLSIDQSDILSPTQKALQKSQMDDEDWEQEYRCNPNAAIKGTYYAAIISKIEAAGQTNRLDVYHNPELPVTVFSDLGVGDSTALWFFQRAPDGYAVIDYHEAHSKDLSYYYTLLRNKPFRYDRIWLPHDAKQRTLQTGRGTIELFLQEDKNCPFARFNTEDHGPIIRLGPRLELQPGINAVRHVLPMCWFSPAAADGLEALRAYRREYDEDKKVYMDTPDHNWASHGSDAFRYFAMSIPSLPKKEATVIEFPRPVIKPARLCLEDLFKQREQVLRMRRGRL